MRLPFQKREDPLTVARDARDEAQAKYFNAILRKDSRDQHRYWLDFARTQSAVLVAERDAAARKSQGFLPSLGRMLWGRA